MSANEKQQGLDTLAALLDARDALSNAVAWLDDMHPTASRVERRRMYAAALELVRAEVSRMTRQS